MLCWRIDKLLSVWPVPAVEGQRTARSEVRTNVSGHCHAIERANYLARGFTRTCTGQLVERVATACLERRIPGRGGCARLDRFQADVKPSTGDSGDTTMVNYPRVMTFS